MRVRLLLLASFAASILFLLSHVDVRLPKVTPSPTLIEPVLVSAKSL
jgi:hypothetical protein